jgi:metal-dependent amidase/aminoacylase/carboxypeptidase family protein
VFSPNFMFLTAILYYSGYPLGQIILRKGAFTASVRSLKICIHGKPSHAAEPENGINPSLTVAKILIQLDNISNNDLGSDRFRVITPVHVKVGEVAYGVSAGYGELHLTIRTWTESEMTVLVEEILETLTTHTSASKTTYTVNWTDIFRANENTDDAVDILEQSAVAHNYNIHHSPHPMKWGEDFGTFTQSNQGSFFGIGAGEVHPSLHNDDYDYPDEILIVGLNMFVGTLIQFQMIAV